MILLNNAPGSRRWERSVSNPPVPSVILPLKGTLLDLFFVPLLFWPRRSLVIQYKHVILHNVPIRFVKFQDNCLPSRIIIHSPLMHRQKQLLCPWLAPRSPSFYSWAIPRLRLAPFDEDIHSWHSLRSNAVSNTLIWYAKYFFYSLLLRQSYPAS